MYLGAIFGIDVGGSLTKIVYFETHPSMTSTTQLNPMNTHHAMDHTSQPSSNYDNVEDMTKISQMKRIKSLERLHTPDYQEALQKLYSYMNEPQTFHNKQGLRDDALSFYSDVLGGRIHFLHFETRRMSSKKLITKFIMLTSIGAIRLLSSTSIIENIRTIGCTGGGAHKYAKEFEEELEITFAKVDELSSLIRGDT